MINDSAISAWLSNFDEPTKAVIQHVINAETWPCDDRHEVQELLNAVSVLLNASSTDQEASARDMSRILEELGSNDIVEMQAQFNFPRALKLFGDLVNLQPEIAKKLITANLTSDHTEEVAIASSTLVKRILFLSKMSIFQRVLTDRNQYKFVMEALNSYEIGS